MSYEIFVTGIGIVCALGNTIDLIWRRLLAGETGIIKLQIAAELPVYPVGLTKITDSPEILLHEALNMALDDAGRDFSSDDCGIAIASSRSQQSTWEKLAGCSNLGDYPALWLDSLPHMLAVQVARQLGVTDLVASPMSACTSGLSAIAQGVEWLQAGMCRLAIVGATESCLTPLNFAGFERIGALAATGAYPFDLKREGMVLGAGAAVLLLEAVPRHCSPPQKAYGRILGYAFSNDGYHPTAPDPDYHLAARTIELCLERSKISQESVGYVHAHGTGTRLNDRREARLLQHLFPQGVPVSSTKGATGHTLGASGILGAAFSLLALQQQILPPCTGLSEPEFDLDFVLHARHQPIETSLCLGFGFGGQNAVLAMGAS